MIENDFDFEVKMPINANELKTMLKKKSNLNFSIEACKKILERFAETGEVLDPIEVKYTIEEIKIEDYFDHMYKLGYERFYNESEDRYFNRCAQNKFHFNLHNGNVLIFH